MMSAARRLSRPARHRVTLAVQAVEDRLAERSSGIPGQLQRAKADELARRRTFGERDLARLDELLARGDVVAPLHEAVARETRPRRLISIRHDMEHDLANSVRLAEWEASRGYRATYYVMQRDWYWGGPLATSPAKLTLHALDRIASLGHEIGLHTNAVAIALQTGLDPFEILEQDLEALRRHGFPVTGSVAHGDPLCHSVGFVNNEIFSECTRAGFSPDRTLTHRDELGVERSVQLRQRPMADFGLEYEANYVGHTLYLSDTGGRWQRPPAEVAAALDAEGGYLQILVHPVWWALSGELVRSRPTIAAPRDPEIAERGDPSAPPFVIVGRGDSCAERAVGLNRDLFGGNPSLTCAIATRSDFLVGHLTQASPDQDELRRVMDVEGMDAQLARAVLGQADRSAFSPGSPQLIVIDDYADLRYPAWRHRRHGWRLWVEPAYLRDPEGFRRDYEDIGYLTMPQALAATTALIRELRERYGQLPVLYLHQPSSMQSALRKRGALRWIGQQLERTLPLVFSADLLESELEPDERAGGDPSQTLLFTGATYRKLVQVALEKGLAEWLPPQATATPS